MQLAVLAAAAAIAAAPVPAAPARWVEDHAALMSPAARDALDGRLESYERATGHQVVVWIGKTLEGAPLADWAVRTFAAWKLGRKGIDDGIAMFILADDRAIDIEVGYGLEDKVTDAAASRIIREVMAPRLRAGDRDGAVTAGAEAVLAAIEGKPWPGAAAGAGTERPTGEQPSAGDERAASPDSPSTTSWIFGGIAGLFALILLIKYPRLAVWILWSILAGGRRGGGSGRFGGGSGGGFGGGTGGGGFSGGGGSSGGGGARGSW